MTSFGDGIDNQAGFSVDSAAQQSADAFMWYKTSATGQKTRCAVIIGMMHRKNNIMEMKVLIIDLPADEPDRGLPPPVRVPEPFSVWRWSFELPGIEPGARGVSSSPVELGLGNGGGAIGEAFGLAILNMDFSFLGGGFGSIVFNNLSRALSSMGTL